MVGCLLWPRVTSRNTFFAFTSKMPILTYSPSFIISTSNELVKISKHYVMISLWFKKHFCFCCIQLFKQCKNFPQTKSYPNSFHFKLEKFRIYFFFCQKIRWYLFDFALLLTFLITFIASSFILVNKPNVLPNFFFKFLF